MRKNNALILTWHRQLLQQTVGEGDGSLPPEDSQQQVDTSLEAAFDSGQPQIVRLEEEHKNIM